MFQWLADLISQIYSRFKPSKKPASTPVLPVSSPALKPAENDSSISAGVASSQPKIDVNVDKSPQDSVNSKTADDLVSSTPSKPDVETRQTRDQAQVDGILGITVETKQENSWDEGAVSWTQYQFYLTNHSAKPIKDVNIVLSSGFKQVWNLVQHDDYMSLPEWVTSNQREGFQIDSTVNFGGIFSEKPEIKIMRVIY